MKIMFQTVRHGWLAFALAAGCADDRELPAFSEDGADPASAGDASCEPGTAPSSGLVRIGAGAQFEVEGQAFLPRGINSYPLLQHVGEGRLDAIDDILTQAVALGRPLLRTPAFMDKSENAARIRADDGSLLEQGLVALDRVLFSAAARGVRLILILTNNWEDFGGAPAVLRMVAANETLPKNAFWSDPRAIAAQLRYQTALATRVNTLNGRVYGQDPTIFAWELANEARCESDVTRDLCPDGTLVRWAKQMSDGLRADGVEQLIAWGGSGYVGEYGEDLRAIAAGGGVDILTLHMYASSVSGSGAARAEAAITSGEATLRQRTQVAQNAGMPLLLEEVNWKPDGAEDRDAERATVLGTWLELADALGVGTLPWMIGERGRPDYDGYLIRPEDLASQDVLRCE